MALPWRTARAHLQSRSTRGQVKGEVKDGLLTMTAYHAAVYGSRTEMHGLSAEGVQSRFVAKVAVALVPIVTFGVADLIRWLLRRTLWRGTALAPRSER